MDQMCVRMLRELQELEFALVELNLYLDTHPCDTQAIKTFNESGD
jgi:spore coat protein JB